MDVRIGKAKLITGSLLSQTKVLTFKALIIVNDNERLFQI